MRATQRREKRHLCERVWIKAEVITEKDRRIARRVAAKMEGRLDADEVFRRMEEASRRTGVRMKVFTAALLRLTSSVPTESRGPG